MIYLEQDGAYIRVFHSLEWVLWMHESLTFDSFCTYLNGCLKWIGKRIGGSTRRQGIRKMDWW